MRKLWLVLFILVIAATVNAAPTVSTVSGTLSDGSNITITGSGFGSGPTIHLFDNFSGHANGEAVGTAATIGTWDSNGQIALTDSLISNNVGGRAVYNNLWYSAKESFPATTQVFFSSVAYVPNGYEYPGATTQDTYGKNTKPMWVYYSSDGYSSCPDFDVFSPSKTDLSWNYYTSSNVGSNCYSGCATSSFDPGSSVQWVWDRPVRWTLWIKANGTSASGADGMFQAVGYNGQTVRDYANFKPWFCTGQTQAIDRISIPGYIASSTTNDAWVIDDVYLATGDNAAARVEIGNSATYTSCTKLAIATINSWGSTSISAKVREGWFQNGDTVYVFVVDSGNNWSTGKGPYTFSGSTGTDLPPVANFSGTPTSGTAPLTVTFSDTSSNGPTSWAWDIDNSGSTDYTTQNPSHAYSAAGTYSVKLTATNSTGSDIETKTSYITVVAADTTDPVVTITSADPIEVTDPAASVEGSASDNVAVTELRWRLGAQPDDDNGTVFTTFPVYVSGLAVGNNTAYIGARDGSGNWGYDSITITRNLVDPPAGGESYGRNLSDDVADGYDTYLNSGFGGDDNYSDATTINTYIYPVNTAANSIILKYDLTGLEGTVLSAKLYLYTAQSGGDTLLNVSAHQITGADPVLTSATWLTYDGVNSWVGGGGILDVAAAVDSVNVGTATEYSWDITSVVQSWVTTPATNYGILLYSGSGTADSYRYFYSCEGEEGMRPRLVIQTEEGAAPPGPGKSGVIKTPGGMPILTAPGGLTVIAD